MHELDHLGRCQACGRPALHRIDDVKAVSITMRAREVAQTCPLCRADLPEGLGGLFDLAFRAFMRIHGMVNRGAVVWASLPAAERLEMEEVVAMLTEAAVHDFLIFEGSICGPFARRCGAERVACRRACRRASRRARHTKQSTDHRTRSSTDTRAPAMLKLQVAMVCAEVQGKHVDFHDALDDSTWEESMHAKALSYSVASRRTLWAATDRSVAKGDSFPPALELCY